MEGFGEVRMEIEKNFRVAQKLAIEIDGKFLVLKCSPDEEVHPNCWDFPGGRLEHGEKPRDGLKREVKEEIGQDVEAGAPQFTFSEKIGNHFTYFVVFKGTIKGDLNEIKISKEHTEFKWATEEEILKSKAEPYLLAYLEGRR